MNRNHIPKGTRIKMKHGTIVVIDSLINAGSQADIYQGIDVCSKRHCAVKHLYGNYCNPKDKEKYYKKTDLLVSSKPCHPDLVMGYDITEPDTRFNFAYVMPLLKGYQPISKIIKAPDKLSLKARLEICRRIAVTFHALHAENQKLVYGDISGSNVLIKKMPNCIDVKIIDTENIIPLGLNLGLGGTGLYRAPEVMDASMQLDIQSDIHAFAVLCFRILCGGHPLDGTITRSIPFTTENILEYFSKRPQFVFDGNTNAPDLGTVNCWKQIPKPLQLYFLSVFSQDCLMRRKERLDTGSFIKLVDKSIASL